MATTAAALTWRSWCCRVVLPGRIGATPDPQRRSKATLTAASRSPYGCRDRTPCQIKWCESRKLSLAQPCPPRSLRILSLLALFMRTRHRRVNALTPGTSCRTSARMLFHLCASMQKLLQSRIHHLAFLRHHPTRQHPCCCLLKLVAYTQHHGLRHAGEGLVYACMK